jgi:putative chitinase
MGKITEAIVKKIAPTVSPALRKELTFWFNKYCFEYEINNELRLAAFFGNAMEESARFSRTEENLNYSAGRLRQVWPARFKTNEIAQQYAKNPKKLANYVYGGRNGNRGVNTDDGWIYRGGGYNQTTGRGNYKTTGDVIGLDLVKNPELLRTPQYAVKSACAEFYRRGCNKLADQRKLKEICKAINGGYNGLAHRQAFYAIAMEALPDGFKLSAPSEVDAPVDLITSVEPHVPDTSLAVDAGVPAWKEPEDDDVDESSDSADVPVVVPVPVGNNTTNEAGGTMVNINTSDVPAEGSAPTPPAKVEPVAGGGVNDKGIEVKEEQPSTWSKGFAAVTTFIGQLGLGTEAYNTILMKGVTELTAPQIVGMVVRISAFVFIIWLGTYLWDRAKSRAQQRTLENMKNAADPDKINTFLKK